jgi:hypothetical protein
MDFIKTILFYLIHIAYFSFMVISIYDIYQLNENGKNDIYLRSIQGIASAVVSIIVGFFIAHKLWPYSPIKLMTESKLPQDMKLSIHEKCFIYSSGLFLFVTGISSLFISVKRLRGELG